MSFQLLTRTEEGMILVGEDPVYGKVIAKTRPYGRLTHEYRVGLVLNGLESPHFVKTLKLETSGDTDTLYITYAQGDTIGDYFSGVLSGVASTEGIDNFVFCIKHLVLILADAAYRTGFNHNDLHNGNILVDYGDSVRYTYQTVLGSIDIESPWRITIIDYGFSHIDGIGNEWAEIRPGVLVAGTVPSVRYDTDDLMLISIRYLVMGIHKRISDEEIISINTLAKKYGYCPFYREDIYGRDTFMENKVDWYFYGRESNPSWRVIFSRPDLINREEALLYIPIPGACGTMGLQDFMRLYPNRVSMDDRKRVQVEFGKCMCVEKSRQHSELDISQGTREILKILIDI